MAKSRMEQMLENGNEEEEDIQFSSSDIEHEWKNTIKQTKSKWMMGIYGEEGTAKSGALMDIRTDEEIENGVKVAIIDIDESCRPLWESYHNCDPNIRIFDPVVSIGKGTERDVSYVASYRKVVAIMGWLEENIEEQNIGYVAIDGIDTFLKWCEYVMKAIDMGDVDVHNSNVGWKWGKRNQRYYRILNWLKKLPVASIITAHKDIREDFQSGQEVDKGANWHNGTRQSTGDELYQIVRMEKKIESRGNYTIKRFVGNIEKWKGDINMEEKKIEVLRTKVDITTNEADYTWHGLIPKIRKYQKREREREEEKKEMKKKNQEVNKEMEKAFENVDDELEDDARIEDKKEEPENKEEELEEQELEENLEKQQEPEKEIVEDKDSENENEDWLDGF